MKLQPKQVNNFIQNIPSNMAFILIYGVDNGLVYEYEQKIRKQYLSADFETSQLIYLSTTILKNEPSRLLEEAYSVSLFGDNKKLIIIEEAKDSITILLKEYLAKVDDTTLIIALANELPPSSSLRKLAESSIENIYSLACYKDTIETITRNIKNSLNTHGFNIDFNALELLANSLGNDRGITNSEIEKLMLYTHQNKHITLADVEAIIAKNNDTAIDKLVYSLFLKQAKLSYSLLEALLEEFNPIAIVRSLINHTLRLLQVKNDLKQGTAYESALTTLRPPLFFMYKIAFRKQIDMWTSLRLEKILSNLNYLELQLKTKSNIANLILKDFIIKNFR